MIQSAEKEIKVCQFQKCIFNFLLLVILITVEVGKNKA